MVLSGYNRRFARIADAEALMLLLIDGYNLLHHSDLLGRGRGERWLQHARERLIQQLVQRLDSSLAAETCLVFDAASPPPDLPDRYRIGGIRIMYAVGYPEADDLLEELIAGHAAPRRLAVVSSDHRVQRAARRRRATFFDADAWYVRLIDRGPQLAIPWPPPQPPAGTTIADREKPLAPIDDEAVHQWMRTFQLPTRSAAKKSSTKEPAPPDENSHRSTGGDVSQSGAARPAVRADKPPRGHQKAQVKKQSASAGDASPVPTSTSQHGKKPTRSSNPPTTDSPARPRRRLDPEAENPFPDGYGEDLLE